MKKIIVSMLLLAMTGCGTANHNHNTSDELPKEVKVEIQTHPETIQPHETVEIQAIVTQDGKPVDDADDVKFEMWKEGEERHEMVLAAGKGDGLYAIETTFPSDGTYHIIAHTNARDMHVMPEVKVTVGTGQTDQSSSTETSHDHDDGVAIHLVADNVKASASNAITAHVETDGQPFTEGNVQFEIWKDGSDKHEYVTASEESAGQYTASPSFAEAGTYYINVHVKKGDVHEHKEHMIEAK